MKQKAFLSIRHLCTDRMWCPDLAQLSRDDNMLHLGDVATDFYVAYLFKPCR